MRLQSAHRVPLHQVLGLVAYQHQTEVMPNRRFESGLGKSCEVFVDFGNV